MPLARFLHRAVAAQDLSPEDARLAMTAILEGAASPPQIAAFLVALRMKGETADEILGFAQAMREKVRRVDVLSDGNPLVDTCGTGGDGLETFNISTIAAFVIAGAGVRVAKHGNRSISSLCGSADVLEAFGISLLDDVDKAAHTIQDIGIGFLYAPAFHPAMRHAQPARVALKMRTAFNLLGPLTNPAFATRQLIGAPSREAAALMATALAGLGTDRSFVVHGFDGLDEISTTGPTFVFEVTPEGVTQHTWTPADFGVRQASLADLRGGGITHNAGIGRQILNGIRGPQRDIVLVNAAAALVVSGKSTDLKRAMAKAAHSIDSGAALRKVEELAAISPAGL